MEFECQRYEERHQRHRKHGIQHVKQRPSAHVYSVDETGERFSSSGLVVRLHPCGRQKLPFTVLRVEVQIDDILLHTELDFPQRVAGRGQFDVAGLVIQWVVRDVRFTVHLVDP